MFVAVLQNTFQGKLELYGPFESYDKALNWVEDIGFEKTGGESLWVVREIFAVK